MSLRQFLGYSLDFCATLNMHHGIEERHVFPNLARRMSVFKNNELMKAQHKEIHSGLDKLQKWLEECKSGEREYRADEMRKIMDNFGDILWKHLDEEVVQLGAENMRKFWTIEEIDRMRF
jgi:hemerythrin-like domain-containing protein